MQSDHLDEPRPSALNATERKSTDLSLVDVNDEIDHFGNLLLVGADVVVE